MNSRNFKHIAAAIGATAIWGTFAVPLRNLKGYPPSEILNYRLFIALIITWIIILLFRRDKIRKDYSYLKSDVTQYVENLFFVVLPKQLY